MGQRSRLSAEEGVLRHHVRVAKGVIAVAVLTAVAALAVAIAALREARQTGRPATYAEITLPQFGSSPLRATG